MKIESIRISNIFSFEYKEKIEEAEPIEFGGKLNILIGSNGAGKSNFIEIVSQLFKRGLLRHENFNENIIKNSDKNSFNKVLTYGDNNSFFNYLQKNKYSDSEKKEILLEVILNEYDFENLKFVIDNLIEINELFGKYSFGINTFNEAVNIEEIKKNNKIKILFRQDTSNQNPSLVQFMNGDSLEKKFIWWYIEHFEFIRRIIEIYNKYEESEIKWPQLKNTFALISCYRNYNAFGENYPIIPNENDSIKEAREKIKNESTKGGNSNDEPAVFDFIKRKLSYRFNDLLHEALSQEDVEKKMQEEFLLKNINTLLKEYLKIELSVRKTSSTELNYSFNLRNDSDSKINISELSAGEKGIFHFICSLYGYDLKNGLMIIDEPELHLHPQIQQAYLKIIERIKDEFDVQFIFATHSPLFVNINTINNVYRFYQEKNSTRVIKPTIQTEEDKDLIRILNYTNSARIFFSNKVVLIEGESDEFFYRKFWDYYRKMKGVDKDEVEFINIEGKGRRGLWENFLKKFKVDAYFIGDWDNVENFGVISNNEIEILSAQYLEKILGKIAEEINKKNSTDRVELLRSLNDYLSNQTLTNVEKIKELRDYMMRRFIPYNELIGYIKENKAEKYVEILEKINEEYKNNIFILKAGELENYLGIEKGLGSVIEFCKDESFNDWINNQTNKAFKDELEEIFHNISK